ncbi:MAG TPA: FtsX-like permease family protein, partial [Bacteroidales bacterium]|nr:FtsX-like permease family protein [Bacteroidales bacterium]
SHLLLQKNKQNIHYLIMLGYSHKQILRPFIQLNALTSVLVFGLSLIPYFILQELWRSNLKAVLSESALNDIWVFIGGMLLLLILGVINILSTSKSIKKL